MSTPDEMDEYLTEAMQDPEFRAACEAVEVQEGTEGGWPA